MGGVAPPPPPPVRRGRADSSIPVAGAGTSPGVMFTSPFLTPPSAPLPPSAAASPAAVGRPAEAPARLEVPVPLSAPSSLPRSAAGPLAAAPQPLDLLPTAVERWMQIQRGMHIVEPSCTIIVRKPGQSDAVRAYIILVFLLTQGSGKDKVFKLAQNIASLVASLATSESLKATAFLADDQFSRVRKGLRMFKSLSEISKMMSNDEEDRRLRSIMYVGNLSSFFYFMTDHVVGLIEMSFIRSTSEGYERAKRVKNVFSLIRLCCAFVVDTWYYRNGLLRSRAARERIDLAGPPPKPGETPLGEDGMRPGVADALMELQAAAMHRAHLRRNFFGNSINLALLLSALGVEPFLTALTRPLIAACGITTATLGIYKLLRRVNDNQLTLQFC